MFNSIYSGKKVLITGHTGFKGSWLTAWLTKMNASVCGVSIDIPTSPSLFEILGLEDKISHNQVDVRDLEKLSEIVETFQPDFIFHLAAQAIVSTSYADPLGTITTNIIGTTNILEAARKLKNKCAIVMITSDKCYENVEWEWGYRETDSLGGKDIYSASKGAAEVIISAYVRSFYNNDSSSHLRVATGRAGNVIGGGDWAMDRIVADAVRSWNMGKPVKIRSPDAPRPWQHVLEPLSGYLLLGDRLYSDVALHGQSFNFGPLSERNKTVEELLQDLSKIWGLTSKEQVFSVVEKIPFNEAGLLRLVCDKATFHLKWSANMPYSECVTTVGEWYREYYNGGSDMLDFTYSQIKAYEGLAKARGLVWAE